MGDGAASRGTGGNQPTAASARRVLPVAALLFAPASVMGSMARNLNQVTFADVLPALAGTLAFALLVWLAVAGLRRRADVTAAVIAGVWVAGTLYYLDLTRPLNRALEGGYPAVRPLPFALLALALLTLLALRFRRPLLPALHTVLTAVAAVMLATPTWQAAAYAWREGDARAAYDADRAAAALPQVVGPAAAADRPPDIYHFVFDRYGSADMLERHYGVEETIGGFLEQRGFYVARDSHSNYLKTGHSLASTFYMDYLDLLADDPRVEGANWHPIFAMLDDHRVARFLKARGYEMLQFGSWWDGTHTSPVADRNSPHGFSEFNMQYLKRTMVRPVFHLLPDVALTMRLDWDNAQCQRVARQVEEIEAVGARERPVYVFAHILVPHGPYVFDRDGRCMPMAEAKARGRRQGYIDQIAYANRIIEDLVATLQADDRPPAVILVQADEGPFPERDGRVPWQEATAEELRIKTGILNAYYFPGRDYAALRPGITPVNSYRVLFNALFGTDFAQLPDRVFAFPNDFHLYDFHDVTDRVLLARGGTASATDPAAAPESGRTVRD